MPGTNAKNAPKKSKAPKNPSNPVPRGTAPGPGLPVKTQKSGKVKAAAAAVFSDAAPSIGMRDLRSHQMSWLAGYVYVGDGTNGATDSVYFKCAGAAKIVPGTSGGGQIPVLASDTRIGQSYITDVAKHYARKVIRGLRLRLVSLTPSTTNSMIAVIAPVAGCSQSGSTIVFWGATTASPTLANTMGMAGSVSVASYQSTELNLMPFVRGGSAARQNEFNIDQDGEFSDSTWGDVAMDLMGIAPCAFVVSGSNATTGLRGTTTHMVIIDQVVDFVDFLGGNSDALPESFSFKGMTHEELKAAYRALTLSSEKEARDTRLVKRIRILLDRLAQ